MNLMMTMTKVTAKVTTKQGRREKMTVILGGTKEETQSKKRLSSTTMN